MLSYQEIGAAAMMSRATRRPRRRTDRRLAAGIGGGRAAGDGETPAAGARTSRPAGGKIADDCLVCAPSNRPSRSTKPAGGSRTHVRPIERAERVALDDAAGRVAAADVRVGDRRAALRAVGHGRLRRDRGRHARPRRAIDRSGCGSSTAFTRAAVDQRTRRTGHLRRNRHRRAAARRRRRRRHGRGNGARRRTTRLTSRPRRPRGRTSAAAAPTSRRATSWCVAGDLLNPSRIGAAGRHRLRGTWRSSRGRASPCCPPATKSSTRAGRSAPARSTTSTASRSPPSSPRTAACPSRIARRRTRWTRSSRRSTAARAPISSCSPAAARSANATSSSIWSRRAATMIFHGIAVKPGKPTAFAIVDGIPFFGMPGNPTSCLSNAYILLVPFLRATARLPLYAPRTRPRAARPTHRLAGGPSSVLHRPPAGRRRPPRLQGLRRHHEPLAGRRLHRDSSRANQRSKLERSWRSPCSSFRVFVFSWRVVGFAFSWLVLPTADAPLVLLLEHVRRVQVEGRRGALVRAANSEWQR